jgi:YHS domain-containing protein
MGAVPREGQMTLVRDPVCGMKVDEKKTSLKSESQGETFYFCSAACKRAFDGDPRKYAPK